MERGISGIQEGDCSIVEVDETYNHLRTIRTCIYTDENRTHTHRPTYKHTHARTRKVLKHAW